MTLIADVSEFASFLWLRGDALTPALIEQQVVRPGAALGPVALGELESTVQSRLAIERLPRTEGGYCPQLEPEYLSMTGFAAGTEAWKLTATGELLERYQGPRRGWIEWASDAGESRAVVLVRYCVGFDLYGADDGAALFASMREAISRTHGVGVEHKKKHKRSRARPITWTLPDALLTLGMYDRGSVRLVVMEMVAERWKTHDYLRIEYLL